MTLFEKIANHEIPATIVHEADDIVAFRDINPQAPQHVIIIPRRAIASVNEVESGDEALLGKMVIAAKKIASDLGIAESGYRIVINCGPDAGQSVDHIHMHLLGGRSMAWPPG